ncbi:eukaryotic translation elongation factor 1 delta a (guanine nucleotide exchange protein) isoform X2 [Esox lucius]|uniref:Translation elongation factor EF1B beta/delta subunit guanine nucleotide exchange domain-containing protein n=1 Tax=Esox lucius TaxID=8010 RepID=A0A6Q2Z3R4_ESOLU|nr:eukaryotic translation elongation factor 1 delta a (guanine nucleotide exchange protein) isoform X2 [Esox lucius]
MESSSDPSDPPTDRSQPIPHRPNGPVMMGFRNASGRTPNPSSQSESLASGAASDPAAGLYGQSPNLHGMMGEMVWYNRSISGQVESASQRPAGTLPSSPKDNHNTGRTLTFRSKRPHPPQEEGEEHHTSHGSSSRGGGRVQHAPSSSEPHHGKGGAKGIRRRGHSETESPQRNIIMSAVQCLAEENIWFEKPHYDEAERRFYEGANGPCTHSQDSATSVILHDIVLARQNIKNSLDGSSSASGDQDLVARVKSLELENQGMQKVVEDLRAALLKLESRVQVLERSPAAPVPCANSVKVENGGGDEEDDDIDLFGSDEEEDAEAEKLKEERIAAYAAKKSKKPALIAKSSILLDVKPWDDETDMAKLEECVRSVVADGLLWGQSKLVPVGYGIKKLQIGCVVEDDKVGTDLLEEEITKFEDYVQSVDVAAFNKI